VEERDAEAREERSGGKGEERREKEKK